MRLVLLVLLACAATACGNQGKKVGAGIPPNLTDTTDRKACSGAADPNTKITSHSWHFRQSTPEFSLLTTYKFDDTSVTVTNNCSWSTGVSLSVDLTLPAQVGTSQVTIRMAGQKQTDQDVGNLHYKCEVAQQARAFTFGFVGKCLSLQDGINIKVLVP